MNLEGMEIDIVVSQLKGGIFLEKAAKLGINFRELSGSQRKLFKNYRSFGKILRERGYDVKSAVLAEVLLSFCRL